MKMIYPERREIPEAEVLNWYLDLMTDDARRDGLLFGPDAGYDEAEAAAARYRAALRATTSIEEAILYLEDAGEATFMTRED